MDGSAPSELHAGDRTGNPAEEHTSEWPRISDYWPDTAGANTAAAPGQTPDQQPSDGGQAAAGAVSPQAGDSAALGEPTAPHPIVYSDDAAAYPATPDQPGPTRLIS